jgi:hypothetical protein
MAKYLTNQQLLKELEKRLPDFTQSEISVLIKLIETKKEEVLKIIQLSDPRIYG